MRAWVAVLGCALCCALVRGSEDIVVGCGGFVKSDVEINYSLIEVGAVAAPLAAPHRGTPAHRRVQCCLPLPLPLPSCGRAARRADSWMGPVPRLPQLWACLRRFSFKRSLISPEPGAELCAAGPLAERSPAVNLCPVTSIAAGGRAPSAV